MTSSVQPSATGW